MTTQIKLKHIAKFVSGVGFPEDMQGANEGDYPFMKVSDINGSSRLVSEANNHVSKGDVVTMGWRPIAPGSILMAKIGAALTKNHRKVLTVPALIDNNMLAATPNNVDKNFFYWLWKTIDLTDHQNISSVPSVNMESLKNMRIELPAPKEQSAIASYLDSKTQTLDKILTAKNHTHTHLSELRQAIITNAVRTGGAIMNAPKVRLKSIAKIYNGATPKSDNPEYWDGDIAWATPVDMSKLSGKFIKSTQRTITQAGYASCNTTLLQPGNIVISNRAPIGLVVINDVPLCTNQGCKAMKIDSTKIDVVYLYYVLSSMTDDLNNLGTGTTFMEISSESLKNIEIPLPTLEEQRKIAEVLDAKIANLDNANSKLSASVKLLEEYRSSLISNVVGGKVEV